MYSGVGGPNGADYVAEFLARGFSPICETTLIGRHGSYPVEHLKIPAGTDLVVHSSGFNLTPDVVRRIRDAAPLYLWTHNDEIGWWRDRIAPVTNLVDVHFSYTRRHGWGDHVKYLPLAADPTIYFPMEKREDYDLALIGAARHWRKTFCELLERRGGFRCYWGWAMSTPAADVNRIYNATRVVIAPVQDCDEDEPGRAWGCPCRTFDVPAAGAFQIQVDRGGLADVYPDAVALPAIRDIDAAADFWLAEIRSWLDNPGARRDQADRDYRETISRHTYRHRAQTMIDHFNGKGL